MHDDYDDYGGVVVVEGSVWVGREWVLEVGNSWRVVGVEEKWVAKSKGSHLRKKQSEE